MTLEDYPMMEGTWESILITLQLIDRFRKFKNFQIQKKQALFYTVQSVPKLPNVSLLQSEPISHPRDNDMLVTPRHAKPQNLRVNYSRHLDSAPTDMLVAHGHAEAQKSAVNLQQAASAWDSAS